MRMGAACMLAVSELPKHPIGWKKYEEREIPGIRAARQRRCCGQMLNATACPLMKGTFPSFCSRRRRGKVLHDAYFRQYTAVDID